MELSNLDRLDPQILLGIVNEKLRLGSGNLADLAAEMELDSLALEQRLAEIGFHYHNDVNQFRRG
ncbi:DUF4250 domain-containing protein [Ferrimonas marina]|uniref:DUF4250 domain-containing protein n=1 Tax=Ferrimonas marina TaxID=299255 RepID=A0A1M5VQ12_9GAMM|nr:DUF4250 domain-containing protein [Ferrimonas marina]SHH77074.1 protein of unknown function [Ferrimonas marina]